MHRTKCNLKIQNKKRLYLYVYINFFKYCLFLSGLAQREWNSLDFLDQFLDVDSADRNQSLPCDLPEMCNVQVIANLE
jgi:hypothetical protein